MPFHDENDFFPDDAERCKQLYESLSPHNNRRRIDNVKAILMKHLDSVEEGTERAHDTKNEEVGAMMDSTHAQEQDDSKDACYQESRHTVKKGMVDTLFNQVWGKNDY